MSTVWRNNRIEPITSKDMIEALRVAMCAIGEELLDAKKEKVGTHSIKSAICSNNCVPERLYSRT